MSLCCIEYVSAASNALNPQEKIEEKTAQKANSILLSS